MNLLVFLPFKDPLVGLELIQNVIFGWFDRGSGITQLLIISLSPESMSLIILDKRVLFHLLNKEWNAVIV